MDRAGNGEWGCKMNYEAFLQSKARMAMPKGIAGPYNLPSRLFPFQKAIVERHLRLGSGAVFAGTGLGKTGIQLAWADAVEKHMDGQVLILTPLAVAQQTVKEAVKFEINGVGYSEDQSVADHRIVVTNYDRLERFSPAHFSAIVLDESSIIKSQDSKTRIALTDLFQHHEFKLACSATPAPNDWTELGNHSEFLGVLSAKEMLATYFVHDGGIRAGETPKGASDSAGWRLKRHAQRDFWKWVASWSTFLRHPRDIGFEEDGYDLPPLIKHQVTVKAEYAPQHDAGLLFPLEAKTLSERIGARRDSFPDRVAAAAAIVNSTPEKPWLVWCQLNDESDALEKAIPGSMQVKGSDSRTLKAERLLGFCEGRPRVLISKPSLAGFGLNYQHCADMVFCGLNDSFEQLFQAIRRCWRFGQSRPVNIYMIASELEGAVVANLEEKERDFEAMADAMADHMLEFASVSLRDTSPRTAIITHHRQPMELPSWL
jgi:hypothetical protein